MENRREYYRHVFSTTVCLPVRLIAPNGEPCPGTIVDMSIGGISVRLLSAPPEPSTDERWFASFVLAPEQRPILLPALLIHYQASDPPILGLRFLPLIDPRANEDVQRRIWCYLIAEQCRQRRQQ